MSAPTLTHRILEAHLDEGRLEPGEEIALRVDQTLTQDATGTMVMLELEAMGLDRVTTESVQYVDHNLLATDHRNADDHRFLRSAARRFGIWFSPPGNGVSHPVHQDYFGRPGLILLGSDSHTTAAGALGMIAFGAGGLDVAAAMAGLPYRIVMPRVWRIELTGSLQRGVSAKDVILELLRRHGVAGARGAVLEYGGPGLDELSCMDRHVIANMGTELGATTSLFPSDDAVEAFLVARGRAVDFERLDVPDDGSYDRVDTIALNELEPLIAMPQSPGNVRTVAEMAGRPIGQAYVGSSANPGFRDFAIVARMVDGERVAPGVSLDVNPTSRRLFQKLLDEGDVGRLLAAGARFHQPGCNGCIGMGQAPATGTLSLRTVPRNFPGRSGTIEDQVALVSPETAAASALTGVITDPRERASRVDPVAPPSHWPLDNSLFEPPLPQAEATQVTIERGPNIRPLPEFDPIEDLMDLPILLVVGDDLSTDEILPAGSRVLPDRSNLGRLAQHTLTPVDPTYPSRTAEHLRSGGHVIAAGSNYGQGSSREHAALAPRVLGLRVVLAESFARIHRRNLVNVGIAPLLMEGAGSLQPGHVVHIEGLLDQIDQGPVISLTIGGTPTVARHDLTSTERDRMRAGSLMNHVRRPPSAKGATP
jgi:aconitate hydratase